MAYDDYVGVHGLDGEGGVVEGLPFLHAAATAGHVNHVGAQYLTRLLKGDPCASAGLVEEGDDGLAPESGHLLDIALQHLLHGVGVTQDRLYLFPGEVVQVQDVPAFGVGWGLGSKLPRFLSDECLACLCHASPFLKSTTSSTPSISVSRTCISSSREVGTFLPT